MYKAPRLEPPSTSKMRIYKMRGNTPSTCVAPIRFLRITVPACKSQLALVLQLNVPTPTDSPTYGPGSNYPALGEVEIAGQDSISCKHKRDLAPRE